MRRAYYEIDPFNRLVINGEESGLRKFRRVLEGRFKIGENNNLSYQVKAPQSESEKIPHRINIGGNWSLDGDHRLCLSLDKESRRTFGDKLTIEGRLLGAEKDSLTFSVTTKRASGGQATYTLVLRGLWKADENNRLSFAVKKEGGSPDILHLNGAWEINKDHEIVYRYEKAVLIRKKKSVHGLSFKGHWDIKGKARISYVLDGDSGSCFDFKTGIGIPAENYIKYEAGIKLEGRIKPVKRTIALFGRWKFKRGSGLSFEIKYNGGKINSILFGADIALAGPGMVSFKLKDSVENKDLGMELVISKKILRSDGEIFLRALASKSEVACYAGAAWRW
ncbi:MAG: hypothetical protein PHI58_00435 [Candidatus Omnitrophica bacterium]|nr:hypothetical protein [Candidatus Omnitrophota bacterium]